MHWIRDWLVPEWKHVLKRSWAIRATAIGMAFSGGEMAWPYLAPSVHVSPGWLGAITFAISAGAFLTRLMPQSTMPEKSEVRDAAR